MSRYGFCVGHNLWSQIHPGGTLVQPTFVSPSEIETILSLWYTYPSETHLVWVNPEPLVPGTYYIHMVHNIELRYMVYSNLELRYMVYSNLELRYMVHNIELRYMVYSNLELWYMVYSNLELRYMVHNIELRYMVHNIELRYIVYSNIELQ